MRNKSIRKENVVYDVNSVDRMEHEIKKRENFPALSKKNLYPLSDRLGLHCFMNMNTFSRHLNFCS